MKNPKIRYYFIFIFIFILGITSFYQNLAQANDTSFDKLLNQQKTITLKNFHNSPINFTSCYVISTDIHNFIYSNNINKFHKFQSIHKMNFKNNFNEEFIDRSGLNPEELEQMEQTLKNQNWEMIANKQDQWIQVQLTFIRILNKNNLTINHETRQETIPISIETLDQRKKNIQKRVFTGEGIRFSEAIKVVLQKVEIAKSIAKSALKKEAFLSISLQYLCHLDSEGTHLKKCIQNLIGTNIEHYNELCYKHREKMRFSQEEAQTDVFICESLFKDLAQHFILHLSNPETQNNKFDANVKIQNPVQYLE